MDTWVVSDLHLAVERPESLYAGGEALPGWLRSLADQRTPCRIILNGDTFDFLGEEGELRLDAEQASSALRRTVGHPLVCEALTQLGRLLAQRGEVILRLGNHDLELALPAVQQVLRQALQQPPEVAARLQIVTGEAPTYVTVGGVRVLVTHGEHDDPFNRIDYGRLLPLINDPASSLASFEYPAGSLLMRQIVAPIRHKYGLRFLDFLKPDFQGAALVALAVAPEACRELFKKAAWDIAWQLIGHSSADVSFAADSAGEVDLGLHGRLAGASLSNDEEEELATWVHASDAQQAFAAGGLSETLRARIAQAGLSVYARVHRRLAGAAGAAFFDVSPPPDEVTWAERLLVRHGCDVLLTGHTHAARFVSLPQLAYVNSGTWMWLLRLPDPAATPAEWVAWLEELRQNPDLDPARKGGICPERRLTVIRVQAQGEGAARLSLGECQPSGEVVEICSALRTPSAPARGHHV